jgi:hypothetical protein
MQMKTSHKFNELVTSLDDNCNVNFMPESPGGYPNAAETIGNSLLSKAKNLRLITSQTAKSAATIISLAADEILMSDTLELGPIDPQVPMRTGLGLVYIPIKTFSNCLSVQTLNPTYWSFFKELMPH